jgi:hypothetical protein
MSNDEDLDQDDDSKDTALARKVEEQVAYKALRLTREKDMPFAIDMGNGSEVTDKRPLQIMGDKVKSLTVYQKARINILIETFGIEVRAEQNALEYFKTVNGRELSLFTFDATDKGLADAEASLKMAACDLQKLLTAKFSVKFTTIIDDDILEAPEIRAASGALPPDKLTLQLRQPGILELDAAGEALSVSDPAHLSLSGKPLRICFLSLSGKQTNPIILARPNDEASVILVLAQSMKQGNYLVHDIAKYFVHALAQNSLSKCKKESHSSIQDPTDSLAIFRRGQKEREELLNGDRTKYHQIKQLDQQEIDHVYGLLPDGTGKKLRLPNGRLTSNTGTARDLVQQLEGNA